jgi:hypothetical protein
VDFERGNYTDAFIKAYAVIKLAGDAILIAKGYYAPSAKNITKIMNTGLPSLRGIQRKFDKYVANPDKEIIDRRDAKYALIEGKELLGRLQCSLP